jgi:hypothetical protein
MKNFQMVISEIRRLKSPEKEKLKPVGHNNFLSLYL